MLALKRRIERLAAAPYPVLITGESGTGKDLVARALHDASDRGDEPYIAVNCGALPPTLVESLLFGAEEGAYTGAQQRSGHFAEADGGTLFLDEVAELPPSAQAALLRVIEDGIVRPVGGREQRVDVRIVAATHRDLAAMVRSRRFRLDLYHRLAVLRLTAPPLRERTRDLPALVGVLMGSAASRLTPCAHARLAAHAWPGNVRELRHVLLRCAYETDGAITGAHVELAGVQIHPCDALPPGWSDLTMDEIHERIAIAFRRRHGSDRAAARQLRCSATSVGHWARRAAARAAGIPTGADAPTELDTSENTDASFDHDASTAANAPPDLDPALAPVDRSLSLSPVRG